MLACFICQDSKRQWTGVGSGAVSLPEGARATALAEGFLRNASSQVKGLAAGRASQKLEGVEVSLRQEASPQLRTLKQEVFDLSELI